MRKEKQKIINELLKTLSVKSQKIVLIPRFKKFIKTRAKIYTLNNGRKIYREEIVKNGEDGSAVIIIPMIKDELLTVVEPRVYTKSSVGIGFPAGYVNKNEDPVQSAKRELREETGCVAKELILLDSFYQDEGCSRALNRIYLAKDCVRKFNQHLDKDEIVHCISFKVDELIELEKKGYIMGCNSKLAILRLKEYYKEK